MLETAHINLAYTRIVAPIDGRIATSVYTEGALVTANQDAPLTTVQQYQPIYVDITQSTSAVMRLRRESPQVRSRRPTRTVPAFDC